MENKQYTECYIAFLDMLGFKKMIESVPCKDILSIFRRVKKPYSNITLTVDDKTLISPETADAVKIKVMSDSILFYMDASLPNALINILTSCLAFQYNLLNQINPILLRGAIVRGELYAKDDIIFGPGLTQAYLMEEFNAKFPRIIITNNVLNDARQENQSSEKVLKALDSKVLFRDFDAFYTINFPRALRIWDKEKIVYDRLMQKITHVLNSTMDESVRDKYLYLERTIEKYYPANGDSHA